MLKSIIFSLFLLPFFAGCIYKIKIPQGNIVTQEMVDQLKLGMSKRQVKFIMGTPLVQDHMHVDRWDYIDSIIDPSGVRTSKKITLLFNAEQELIAWQGDLIPGISRDDNLLTN